MNKIQKKSGIAMQNTFNCLHSHVFPDNDQGNP